MDIVSKKIWCRGGDLNPRTPMGLDLKSSAVGQAWQPLQLNPSVDITNIYIKFSVIKGVSNIINSNIVIKSFLN